MSNSYALLLKQRDEAATDEGRLETMAKHNQANTAAAILLVAEQIAKLRGTMPTIVIEQDYLRRTP